MCVVFFQLFSVGGLDEQTHEADGITDNRDCFNSREELRRRVSSSTTVAWIVGNTFSNDMAIKHLPRLRVRPVREAE